MNNNDLETQSENIDSEAAIDVDIELEEDMVELTGIGGQKPLKKKNLKSKVWNFFDILPLGLDKKLRSTCKKYGQQYHAASIAPVFDPRYKMQFIEFCYNKAFGYNSVELLSLRAKLESLFDENALKLDHFVSPSTSKKKDKGKSPHEMEVDESDLLKTNQCRYPILAAMARDILCIPISTVALEAAFSLGDRVLDQYCSSLKHDTVEVIMYTRDWLYGNEDGFKVLHQDIEDLIKNVVDLNIHEKKNINQASNSGCA